MTAETTAAADVPVRGVEANGINVIAEHERTGRPRQLFLPWFAANVSVLCLSYGSFVLEFGVSFWQGLVVGLAAPEKPKTGSAYSARKLAISLFSMDLVFLPSSYHRFFFSLDIKSSLTVPSFRCTRPLPSVLSSWYG